MNPAELGVLFGFTNIHFDIENELMEKLYVHLWIECIIMSYYRQISIMEDKTSEFGQWTDGKNIQLYRLH